MVASVIHLSVVDGGVEKPFNDYCGQAGEVSWSNVIGRPAVEQHLVALPGRTRLEYVPITPRTRVLQVGLILAWPTEEQCLANVLALGELIWDTAAPIVLRRTIPASPSPLVSEIDAVYLDGLDPERVDGRINRMVLRFQTLEPFWHEVGSSVEVTG